MGEKMFNLLDERWICVMDNDCKISEISLLELFEKAHEYTDLRGELATQDIAVLRVLLAVLHTVFSRYDLEGKAAKLKDADDALDRWEELWKKKRFPIEPIRAYLETQRERFWLFHPERPFYQCAGMEKLKVKNGEYKAKKLIGTLAESENKKRLFSLISGEREELIHYAESARWLIHICGFDDAACKSGTGIGWLGQLGLVYVVGNNLFETLLLNLVLLNDKNDIWEFEKPVWERDNVLSEQKKEIVFPDNLSELYTLPSRKVFLTCSNNHVNGYKVSGGEYFDSENAFNEPMTLWKARNNRNTESYFPHKHHSSKQFWREFPSAIFQTNGNHRKPGIIRWLNVLEDADILQGDFRFQIKIVAMDYDSKHMSIANVFSDSISFHTALISDFNLEWREMVLNRIEFCEKLANYIWKLTHDVNFSAGGDDDTSKTKANDSKERYYFLIDEPFRRWLRTINPRKDNAITKEKEWTDQCVKIAGDLGKEIISQAGLQAVFGRKTVSKEGNKESSKWVSAAGAMNKFVFKLKKRRSYDFLLRRKGKI